MDRDYIAKSLAQAGQMGQQECCATNDVPRALSLTEQLSMQREKTRTELARLTELIGLLEAHPETERILQLLGGRY